MGEHLPASALVINADDLGMSAELNSAILPLMEDGLVSSATLLANGSGVEEAARLGGKLVGCSLGAHLNITWGRPVGPTEGLEPLLNDAGEFARVAFDADFTPALREAVAREWCCQVRRLLDLGVRLTHLDSHEHVHTLPPLFLAFKAVQRRFGIRRARLSKNLYSADLPPAGRALLVKKALWNFALRGVYRTRTTRWFTDLQSLLSAIGDGVHVGPGSVEAMVHPGATEDPRMVMEVEQLKRGALRAALGGYRLVSYAEI